MKAVLLSNHLPRTLRHSRWYRIQRNKMNKSLTLDLTIKSARILIMGKRWSILRARGCPLRPHRLKMMNMRRSQWKMTKHLKLLKRWMKMKRLTIATSLTLSKTKKILLNRSNLRIGLTNYALHWKNLKKRRKSCYLKLQRDRRLK